MNLPSLAYYVEHNYAIAGSCISKRVNTLAEAKDFAKESVESGIPSVDIVIEWVDLVEGKLFVDRSLLKTVKAPRKR